MDKAALEKLKLEIGQKIDLFSKEVGHSPHNVVFDGIKEYNDYGTSDIYVLYHRVEAIKLEDVRKIGIAKQGEELVESSDVVKGAEQANTTDNTNATAELPNKTNVSVKKYECSCGKVYSHYASWYQHAKKTGHAKKA